MAVININKLDLINLISEYTDGFGSPSLTICVDVDGDIDARYNSERNEDWMPILSLLRMRDFVDANNNMPGSDAYDSQQVAKRIVDEKELLILNASLNGVAYNFALI